MLALRSLLLQCVAAAMVGAYASQAVNRHSVESAETAHLHLRVCCVAVGRQK